MTTRAGIVGLGTGGLLLAVLFYPLYVLVPGLYVRGWPSGSVLVNAATVVTALALTILCGWLAARWGGAASGGQRAGLGALAGGLAALLVFCGLGAAAAGTLGSGVVLQSDSAFRNDAAGQAVLLESVSRTVLWTQRMFWGMLLTGLVLGAVGGRCCTTRPVPASQPLYNKAHPQMALNVSIAAVPATAVTAILAAAIFLRVSEVIRNMAGASVTLASASLYHRGCAFDHGHVALPGCPCGTDAGHSTRSAPGRSPVRAG